MAEPSVVIEIQRLFLTGAHHLAAAMLQDAQGRRCIGSARAGTEEQAAALAREAALARCPALAGAIVAAEVVR